MKYVATSAQARIHLAAERMDPRFHGHDNVILRQRSY